MHTRVPSYHPRRCELEPRGAAASRRTEKSNGEVVEGAPRTWEVKKSRVRKDDYERLLLPLLITIANYH